MAIALVAHTSGRSTDGNGFTTGAIDTSGANFLIISIATAATGDTVSDSKGNTWTPLTENAGLFSDRWQRFFYAKNATVGSGHTFSVSGASSFPSLCVAAFSGVDTTSPFDTENTANDFNNTVHAGSITPAGDNELLVAGLEYDDDSSDPTIDLSYTLSESQRLDGGKAVGGALAYLIETTGATKNPAFSWTNGGRCVGGAAAFKAATGGGTTDGAVAASGTGAAALVGASTAASTASASGVGALSAVGASIAAAVVTASGTGAVSAVGTGIKSGVIVAAGAGDAPAVGASIAAATISASGAGDVHGTGASTAAATVTAAGAGDAPGVGASTAASVLAASGAGAVAAVGQALAGGNADVNAAGSGAANMVGASIAAAVVTASGAGDFHGQSPDTGVLANLQFLADVGRLMSR